MLEKETLNLIFKGVRTINNTIKVQNGKNNYKRDSKDELTSDQRKEESLRNYYRNSGL